MLTNQSSTNLGQRKGIIYVSATIQVIFFLGDRIDSIWFFLAIPGRLQSAGSKRVKTVHFQGKTRVTLGPPLSHIFLRRSFILFLIIPLGASWELMVSCTSICPCFKAFFEAFLANLLYFLKHLAAQIAQWNSISDRIWWQQARKTIYIYIYIYIYIETLVNQC